MSVGLRRSSSINYNNWHCMATATVPARLQRWPWLLCIDRRDLEARATASSRKSSAVTSGGWDLSGLTQLDPFSPSQSMLKEPP